MSIRQQKGLQIAQKANIRRHGQLWVVPSETGKGKYTVDAKVQRCTCPDWDFRRQPCKHIFAVQVTIEREQTTVTEGVTGKAVLDPICGSSTFLFAALTVLRLGWQLGGKV